MNRTLPFLLTLLTVLPYAIRAAPPAMTVGALRQALADEAIGTEFDMTATVTVNRRLADSSFTVQDGTNAVSVWNHIDADPESFRPGDRVRLCGRLNRGRTSRVAADCYRLEVLSRDEPLTPVRTTLGRLQKHGPDQLLVQLEGTITDAFPDEIDTDWIYLVLKCHDGTTFITTRARRNMPALDRLIGATVSVAGIYGSESVRGERQLLGKSFSIDSLDSVHILKGPSDDTLDAESLQDLSDLNGTKPSGQTRYHADGTVIAVWERNKVLVRTDANHIIRGELNVPTTPHCGERIRLVGFPETDLYTVILVRAAWRTLPGNGLKPSAPVDLQARQIKYEQGGVQRYRFGFHGQTVRLRGIVRGTPIRNGQGLLYLECDGQMVTVDVSAISDDALRLETDYVVSVCGVCVMETEKMSASRVFPRINGYKLVMRTPDDLRVVSRPSWWTSARLLGIIGTLVLVIAAIIIWNRSLVKIAERKSQALLKEQLARVKTEFKVDERTRLSVELHDTLSQNLVGAAMEVNTAEQLTSDEGILMHLNLASRTIKASRDELRNCLWDLRSQALEEPDMNSAIRKTLEPYINDIDLHVRFNVPRRIFTDNTAHALMRIIRELVLNAIRHGHAKAVKIAGSRENGQLLFSVRDDGCGFDPSTAPGIAQGHFGIQGVRERLRLLKGTISVKSAVGKGTHVSARLQLPDGEGEKI